MVTQARAIQTLHSLILALALTTILGCDFGTQANSETTTPSAKQIQHCRKAMYINPDVEISPLGHCLDFGFQDDVIHFKFIAKTDKIEEIFQSEFVSPDKLVPRNALDPPRYGLAQEWWDASQHSLTGGDFFVPDPRTSGDRGLRIGILKNGDGTCTVYSSWLEI